MPGHAPSVLNNKATLPLTTTAALSILSTIVHSASIILCPVSYDHKQADSKKKLAS